jgi:hypothetical protein
MRMAGKDATRIFAPLHPPGTLESGIDADKMMGLVDPNTVKEVEMPVDEAEGAGKMDKIPLGQIIGLPDFEVSLAGVYCCCSQSWRTRDAKSHGRFAACCRALVDAKSMVLLLGGSYR